MFFFFPGNHWRTRRKVWIALGRSQLGPHHSEAWNPRALNLLLRLKGCFSFVGDPLSAKKKFSSLCFFLFS